MKKLTLMAIGAVVLFGLPVPEHVHSAPPAGVVSVEHSKLDDLLDVVSMPKAFANWDDMRQSFGTFSVTAGASATLSLTGTNRYVVASCSSDCRILVFPQATGATCTATTCDPYAAGEKAYFRLPPTAPGLTQTLAAYCAAAATCTVTRAK